MKNEIKEYATKINNALKLGLFSSVKNLIDSMHIDESLTTLEELDTNFSSIGLSLNDDAPEGLTVFYAAVLIKLNCLNVDTSSIDNFLDSSVDKWEQIEDSPWSALSESLTLNFFDYDGENCVKDHTRYWFAIVNFRQGEHISGHLYSLVKSDHYIADEDTFKSICGLQAAHGFNCGVFDDICYGVPCFDAEGFITYPNDVIEISQTEFVSRSKHIKESWDYDPNMDGEVKEACLSQLEDTVELVFDEISF